MNTRYNTWTGGEYYFIIFENGQHHVKKASPDWSDEPNETMFSGNWENCKQWIDEEICRNYEYDHNI